MEEDMADMPMVNGKKLTEMTSDEILGYHDEVRPKLIKAKKKE